jgi:hypothetical protein
MLIERRQSNRARHFLQHTFSAPRRARKNQPAQLNEAITPRLKTVRT